MYQFALASFLGSYLLAGALAQTWYVIHILDDAFLDIDSCS